MMENTAKLLDEIAKLKEKLHKHDKAIARIDQWLTRDVSNPNTEGRTIERETLKAVLRIFEEEEKHGK